MWSRSSPRKTGGRTVVQLDVVEWVGEDLGRPDQPCLHIPDLEKLHRAKQQSGDAECEPQPADVPHKLTDRSVWFDGVQQRGVRRTGAAATAPRSSGGSIFRRRL